MPKQNPQSRAAATTAGNTTRNGQSGPAAGAAGTNPGAGAPPQGGGPASGPAGRMSPGGDPMAALVEALAPTFEGDAAVTTNPQGQPADDAGRTTAGAETAGGTAEEESHRQEPTEPPDSPDLTGGNGGNGEGQDQPGGNDGTTAAPTESGQEPAGETATEGNEGEVPIGVEKRIGKLLERMEGLQAENERLRLQAEGNRGQRPEVRGQLPEELAEIHDAGELDVREMQARKVCRGAEGLLGRLQYSPGRVERELRQMGVKVLDEQGNEDYSAERMGDLLMSTRDQAQATLDAVPARRAFLQNYAAAHKQVLQVRPWIGDRTDRRQPLVQEILTRFPQLRSAPNWEYWVAAAVEGHEKIQGEIRAKTNGGAATARTNGAGQRQEVRGQRSEVRAGSSGPSARPGAAVRPGTNGAAAKLQAAVAKVKKEGTKEALSEAFEAMGF